MLVKIERGVLYLLGAAMLICVFSALVELEWGGAFNFSVLLGLVMALLMLSAMRGHIKHLCALNQILEEKNQILEEALEHENYPGEAEAPLGVSIDGPEGTVLISFETSNPELHKLMKEN